MNSYQVDFDCADDLVENSFKKHHSQEKNESQHKSVDDRERSLDADLIREKVAMGLAFKMTNNRGDARSNQVRTEISESNLERGNDLAPGEQEIPPTLDSSSQPHFSFRRAAGSEWDFSQQSEIKRQLNEIKKLADNEKLDRMIGFNETMTKVFEKCR